MGKITDTSHSPKRRAFFNKAVANAQTRAAALDAPDVELEEIENDDDDE